MHGGNAPQASNATVEHFSARAERIALAAFHNALVSIYDDLGLCQAHATYSHTNTRIWHHQHDCLPLFCQNYILGPPPFPSPRPTTAPHSVCSQLPPGFQAEIIRAHGLVGLNQLLLANTGSGKVAGARLVGVLAGSPDFHKSASRQGIVVNVAQLLAFESARVRTAAAGARELPSCGR